MYPNTPVSDGDPSGRRTGATARPVNGAEGSDSGITAECFVARLSKHASERVRRQLGEYVEQDPSIRDQRPGASQRPALGERPCSLPAPPARVFLGVPIGQVFVVASRFVELPLGELERLLDREEHEVRAGAVFVMSQQARARWAPPLRRRRLYLLYLRRLDRIDNWDLVDLGAPQVVGGYLLDQPRDVLYALAASTNRWARRTALLAALRLVRAGQFDDACALSELLLDDSEDMVQKPIGGLLREVGERDLPRLSSFLKRHAGRLGRAALGYAVQPLDAQQRAHYLTRSERDH